MLGGQYASMIFLFPDYRAAAKIEIRVLDQIRAIAEDGQE